VVGDLDSWFIMPYYVVQHVDFILKLVPAKVMRW
jgi:hypothetical protein